MTQKRVFLSISAFLLVVVLLAGYAVIAAELGSKEDPLVTLSYLNDELTSSLMTQVDEQIAAKTEEFNAKKPGSSIRIREGWIPYGYIELDDK